MTFEYRPDPRHLDLGPGYFDAVAAARFPKTILRYRNQRWADRVGLGGLDDTAWLDHFGRFVALPGNLPQPLALRYHGHQFRSYNPNIGDGRGFLFAQLRDEAERLLDLGTKGSGRTPYSRSGDGRLTLKGGVREVLATSMLEALGVYSSKSFSLIETGEALQRNDEPSPTRSSVLVRLSHSHIRFGSFQRLAYEQDIPAIGRLVEHCCRYYLAGAEGPIQFLTRVIAETARLGASWMAAGFVHGVLNSDNVTITGESFDYGPYRFLPVYRPDFVAAYFDQTGLYAYGRQPEALRWNLTRLAECLLDLAPEAELVTALEGFEPLFLTAMQAALAARLGIRIPDAALTQPVFRFLRDSAMPFEQFFFDWFGGPASRDRADAGPAAEFYARADFAELRALLLATEPTRPERLAHSYFQADRPETLLIDEIEAIWSAIADRDDWGPFNAKLAAIEAKRQALSLIPARSRP